MQKTFTGTATMHGDRVSVNVEGELHTFDRRELLAIVQSNDRELNLWSARGALGLAYRSGNTDQSDTTGRIRLGREARTTRLGFEYSGAYGSIDSAKNTNDHRGRSTLDYFLSRDLFLTPLGVEVFSDEIQNIPYRLTPAAGHGH